MQLAIWSLEYNTTATNFANSTIAADFSLAESWSFQNTGYATELIPVGGWPDNSSLSQGMVVGFAAGAPEPSTWAMGLMGFAGIAELACSAARPRVALKRKRDGAAIGPPRRVAAGARYRCPHGVSQV